MMFLSRKPLDTKEENVESELSHHVIVKLIKYVKFRNRNLSVALNPFFLHHSEMPAKPRTIPPALNLRAEEVTLLTEFALIATSPQSPLVREVSGENSYVKRREDDSPPPQLMVCRWNTGWRRDSFPLTAPFICVTCNSFHLSCFGWKNERYAVQIQKYHT